jgi:hypothetical protein
MQLNDLLLVARALAQLTEGTAWRIRHVASAHPVAANVSVPSMEHWQSEPCRRRHALASWACATAGCLAADAVGGCWCPALGEVLVIADVVIPAVIVFILLAAILRGTTETCERAFRLLRWTAKRPEPPAPKPVKPHCGPRGSGSSASGQ